MMIEVDGMRQEDYSKDWGVLYVRERILYSMRSSTFSQWRDLRTGVV